MRRRQFRLLDDFAIVGKRLTRYRGIEETAVVPDGVREISTLAFARHPSLSRVTLPESVQVIGSSAFDGCTALTCVNLPEGVREIPAYTFSGCTKLSQLILPKGVTVIGNNAFQRCTSLTSMVLPEGLTAIQDGLFFQCTRLASVTIPEGVAAIGWRAFAGCSALTSLRLPASVKDMGDYALQDCSGLREVIFAGPELPQMGCHTFQGADPMILAPKCLYTHFRGAPRIMALRGFARMYLDGGWELTEELTAATLKYIKSQRKRLYPLSIQYEELLQLLLAEQIVRQKDLPSLLEEADRQGNAAARSALLAYAQEMLPSP